MAAIIPCDKCIHGKVCAMGFQFRRETANVTIVCKDFVRKTDVAPRAEVFEEVDKFRADLMNKFIDLCRGNDYNKLTLLKIGDVVDEMYDRRIAELKNKYAEVQK